MEENGRGEKERERRRGKERKEGRGCIIRTNEGKLHARIPSTCTRMYLLFRLNSTGIYLLPVI